MNQPGVTKRGRISRVLLAGLLALGTQTWAAPEAVVESLPGAVRVACVGDSITYGYKVEQREKNSYPARLQQRLGPAYQVGNFGCSGATLAKRNRSSYWNTQEFRDAQAFDPQIVIVMLGTNDAKQDNWKDHASFADDYAALVATFQRLPAKPTVLIALTAAALKGAGFTISPEAVEAQLPLIREIGRKMRIPVVDLHSPLRDQRGWFLTDGVHPNAAGAEAIATAVYQALQEQGLTKAQPATVHVRRQVEMTFTQAAGFRDGALHGQNGWRAGAPFTVAADAAGRVQVASLPANLEATLTNPAAAAGTGPDLIQVTADFSFAVTEHAPLAGSSAVFAVQLARTPEGQDPIRLQLVRWAGGRPMGNLYTLRLTGAASASVQTHFISGDAFGMSQGVESDRLALRLSLYRQPDAPRWIASGYLVDRTTGALISSLQNQPVVSTAAFHAAPGWYGGVNNGGPFGLARLQMDAFGLRMGDWAAPAVTLPPAQR